MGCRHLNLDSTDKFLDIQLTQVGDLDMTIHNKMNLSSVHSGFVTHFHLENVEVACLKIAGNKTESVVIVVIFALAWETAA